MPPKPAIGSRVGAILSTDAETVSLLGYGTYEGDLESPLGFPNPCIKLDSGKKVWGFQCWWGSEAEIQKEIGSRKVIVVDVESVPS